MKKFLLFSLIMCFGASSFAQSSYKAKEGIKSHPERLTTNEQTIHQINSQSQAKTEFHFNKPDANHKSNRDASFVQIGMAGNSWGFAFNGRSYVWADNNINTVSFVHRMMDPPGTGYLAFDVSKDRGDTWETNMQVYDPTLVEPANARYPQGAIYNPPGNTNPDDAYVTYFAPTLDGSNVSGALDWGGYGWGVNKLNGSSTPTQHNQSSYDLFHQQIPNGLSITQTGDLWMLDCDEVPDGSGGYDYNGNLICGHGIFNSSINDFEYDQFLFEAPISTDPDAGVNDCKIAFSPDGQTGYMMMMAPTDEVYYSSYHPILFITENGGEDWDDDLIEVKLGGPDGIEAIKYWLSDEMLAEFFEPPVPNRDSITYFAGFHADLAVDAFGNPHIAVMIAIAGDGVFYSPADYIAIFHIYSNDRGETWDAGHIKTLKTFDGEFVAGTNSVTMYNRAQVATTMDGMRLVFSCLDTEMEGIEDNVNPDIYLRGYSIWGNEYTDLINVTEFTQAWWAAWFGSMSRYVFSTTDGNTEIVEIPLVYQEFTTVNNDPSQPVQFWYIKDVTMEFTMTGTEELITSGLEVSQNFPNPFNETSNIEIKTNKLCDLDLEIYSLAGKLVYSERIDNATAGMHLFTINATDLGSGMYFYTVNDGVETITRKMIVH